MARKKSNSPAEATYIDHKGRVRWHCNDALAEKLKQLYDILVIGNYDESHAARYPRLAHMISRYPESIKMLDVQDRLTELPGVSDVVAGIISELIEKGTCKKMTQGDELFIPPPMSVLELTAIPQLGAKTARTLYQDHGIDSLKALAKAIDTGKLEKIKGIGKGMIATIRQYLEQKS